MFVDTEASRPTSHNLRQLLYRLRGMGLLFKDLPSGLILRDTEVAGPLDGLRQLTLIERSRLTPAELEILPSYEPCLPRLFTTWLEDVKNSLEAQTRRLLLVDVEAARGTHSWATVIQLCETLASLDPANEDVVRIRAEALAMIGRRAEALQVLDTFIRDTVLNSEELAQLQLVRTRIVKATRSRREGTLRARGSCLAFLEGEWEKVGSEGARVSAVLGQAGLGKTRVSEEFAARISLRGAHVVRFECDSQARQQPMSLFSAILPSLRAMRGSLGASPEFKGALALVRPPNDGTEPTLPEGISLEARRADIQSALIDLLEAVTSERPLLLIVDDAHLLDEASRGVLRAFTTTRNAAVLQVLVCARPSSGSASLLAPARGNSVFDLAPLSRQDSLELLLELRAGSTPDDKHVEWCLSQAAGNPFYLHQLATHARSTASALPFDISSLALSSYSSLRAESRAVLEACLLLGRFATMTRAMFVAGIDDHAMLSALRELEEQDLVHFADGHLTGPHALLHDALRALLPSTVSALLHRRIAVRLEEECVADQFTPELAWASAQSWLASADPAAAMHLLRRCASRAADVGEPAAAVELLSQVPSSVLPPKLLATLLDDLSRYGNAGGCRTIAATALRKRLSLARELGEGNDAVNELRLRLAESDLLDGESVALAADAIKQLLTETSAATLLRALAGARLLVIAEIDFDTHLAEFVRAWLRSLEPVAADAQSTIARAELVYHTTFGDLDHARLLVKELLAAFPTPSALTECIQARNYAAFAFYRMGYAEEAAAILDRDYEFMMSRRVYAEALYSASLRTDIALTIGEFTVARAWLARCDVAARGVAPHHLSPNSGFHSNAGILAMMDGRYGEAKEHFLAPQRQNILTTRRYRAVSLALLLRLEQISSDKNLNREDVAELWRLYDAGKSLGGQDAVVEALWCAMVLDGKTASASEFLHDYLLRYRRERTDPSWSLRNSTAADEAWKDYVRPNVSF